MARNPAMRPDIFAGLRRRDVELVRESHIGVAEERPLATMAPLRHVVTYPESCKARHPNHDDSIAEYSENLNCRNNRI